MNDDRHLYCLSCIEHIFNSNNEQSGKCPCCRVVITSENVARNMFVEKAIQKLKMMCPYGFKGGEMDENGCKQQIEFSELEKHKETCEFRFVNCPFSVDCDLLRFRDVDDHKLICKHRIIECQFCKNTYKSFEMEVKKIFFF